MLIMTQQNNSDKGVGDRQWIMIAPWDMVGLVATGWADTL
jgi:hypothetical protein